LSLSASISITKPADSSETLPDFSLRLVRKIPELGPMPQQKVWLSGLVDVRPPSGVLCATVQRIEIRLEVSHVTRKHEYSSKKVKFEAQRSRDEELVLPDNRSATNNLPHVEMLDGVVKHLSKTLSQSISKCFGKSVLEKTGYDSIILDGDSGHLAHISSRQSVAKDVEEMLFSPSLLSDLAANAVVRPDEEMLLSRCHLDLASQFAGAGGQMSLSQTSSSAPPLNSHCSSDSSTSTSASGSSLKRSAASQSALPTSSQTETCVGSGLLILNSHKFMEATTRALFDGTITGSRRSSSNIKIYNPFPATAISKLVPGIFNPGFPDVRHAFELQNVSGYY
jgi:hypothetical protein